MSPISPLLLSLLPILTLFLTATAKTPGGAAVAAVGECPEGGAGGACAGDIAEEQVEEQEDAALLQKPKGRLLGRGANYGGGYDWREAEEQRQATAAREANVDWSWGSARASAYTFYKAKNVLPANAAKVVGMAPPMVVGTEENMDPALKGLGIDLTGIWWIRGKAAQLASYANATVSSSSFPTSLSVAINRKGMCSFVNRVAGRSLLRHYSTLSPLESLHVTFDSNTSGAVDTTKVKDFPLATADAYPFKKINADEWLRPSLFHEGSWLDKDQTMTRIIKADGSAHPKFWPLFLEHMTLETWYGSLPGEQEMISMNTDNFCMRRCQTTMASYVCQQICH